MAIRSLYIKESLITWINAQWKHKKKEFHEVDIVSAYGEGNEPPIMILDTGRQKIVTDVATGLLDYDFFTGMRKSQVTKDIEIKVECVSANEEESLSLAEILVDRIYTSPYSLKSKKNSLSGPHNGAVVSPTVPKRYGEEGYFMTEVNFTVRAKEVKEVPRKVELNINKE